MPGVVGSALWVDFYEPDLAEDAKLQRWFVEHCGFSEFKSRGRRLPASSGDWESARGSQFLFISRQEDSGWVHLSFGQRMPPAEAAKDLETFPWRSELTRR